MANPSTNTRGPASNPESTEAQHAGRPPRWLIAATEWILKHHMVWSVAAIFLTCLVVYWKVNDMTQSMIRDTALRDIESYSKSVAEFRSLYSTEVIKRLRDAGEDVLVTHDYTDHPGAIPLPATLSKLLGNRLGEQEAHCETRLFSDFPFPHRTDGGPLDEFEKKALAALRKNPDQPVHAFETHNGETYLRYATADRMGNGCVQCHNTHPQSPKRDWKLGDVRGVLAMRMPMNRAMAYAKSEVHGALGVFSGVGGVLVAMFFFTTYRLHKQSQRLVASNQQLALNTRQLQHAKTELDVTNAGLRAKTSDLERSRRAALNLSQDMRESRDKAEAAVYAKSQFLAMMSHEIRTPMTAILGYAESLQSMLAEEECLETVATIRRNGEHLLHLINDILDLSKIEANKFDVESIRCSPRDLLLEVHELMRIRAEQRNLEWSVQLDGPIPEFIKSDPARLRQILINLVGNAIKFTEEGGVRLTGRLIESTTNGPLLEIEVADTGIGMTEEQCQGLFQPFMQADNSMARKYGGTGLGLTISKRLALLLGGSVEVRSEIGKGSTFSVRVATGPLDDATMLQNLTDGLPEGRRREEDHEESGHTNLDGVKVLVVEDGVDNQRLIRWLLSKAGADVAVEENGKLGGQAALEAEKRGEPFDVILMDMQMPVMDGYAAAAWLRDENCTSPIVALTAHAMAEDRKKCLDAGCAGFATKPFQRKELINTVASFARNVCK